MPDEIRIRQLGQSRDVVDLGVAAGLLMLVGLQAAVQSEAEASAAYLACSALITLPLAWRRRQPLAAVLATSGMLAAQALLVQPAFSLGEFLAVVLAVYSVGAHASLRTALVGAASALVAVGTHSGVVDGWGPTFEWVYATVYLGGALVVGRLAATRRIRTDEVERRLADLHVDHAARVRAAAAVKTLTAREQEVLVLMADGLTNPEIAARLVISEATVKTHVKHVLAKLPARDRVQAVIAAFDSGIARPVAARDPILT